MLAAFTDALPRDRGHRKALLDGNEKLRRALETRDTIGQAKGILMERFNTRAPTTAVSLSGWAAPA